MTVPAQFFNTLGCILILNDVQCWVSFWSAQGRVITYGYVSLGAVSVDIATLIMQDFQNYSDFNLASVGVTLMAQKEL